MLQNTDLSLAELKFKAYLAGREPTEQELLAAYFDAYDATARGRPLAAALDDEKVFARARAEEWPLAGVEDFEQGAERVPALAEIRGDLAGAASVPVIRSLLDKKYAIIRSFDRQKHAAIKPIDRQIAAYRCVLRDFPLEAYGRAPVRGKLRYVQIRGYALNAEGTVDLRVCTYEDMKIGAQGPAWKVKCSSFERFMFEEIRRAYFAPGTELTVRHKAQVYRALVLLSLQPLDDDCLLVILETGETTHVSVSLMTEGTVEKVHAAQATQAPPGIGAFDCPICREPYGSRRIYQCPDGHALCSRCFGAVAPRKCPSCRVDLRGNRNHALEEAVRAMAACAPNN